MKQLLIIMGLLCSATGLAQPLKQQYINKINQICSNADIIEFEQKDDYAEIEYRCNGKLFEVGISPTLEVLFIESETEIEPHTRSIIDKKISKKYEGWKLDEFTRVSMGDTSFYKAELWKDGIEENVYFTLDGKYFKPKNLVVNEPWTQQYLSGSVAYRKAPYNFLTPTSSYEMPEVLKEISGIAPMNTTTLYAVQDESGAVFKYDLKKESISGLHRFTDVGDFEDVTTDGATLYALRSDGTIFSFNVANFDGKITQTVLQLNSLNAEGIFYNQHDRMLYIVCKDQPIDGESWQRNIYKIDPKGTGMAKLALTIDIKEIVRKIKVDYPLATSSNLQFNPSAIAIHPLTNEMYILSASNKLLAIYKNSKLSAVYPLPAETFYKPEGLAFMPDGSLYISSEGIKKGYLNGQVFFFKPKPGSINKN
ncbi:MAG TPA: hypothetical protein PKV50_06480 [Prolixibacteraceae bacterium]|jgi:uncharacterized protein YjiK|nr:hypothetical protein [Prolixibacteraceae bacterium]HUM89160.1 hypothetical protein [Prolixibacteraceae bacterium]